MKVIGKDVSNCSTFTMWLLHLLLSLSPSPPLLVGVRWREFQRCAMCRRPRFYLWTRRRRAAWPSGSDYARRKDRRGRCSRHLQIASLSRAAITQIDREARDLLRCYWRGILPSARVRGRHRKEESMTPRTTDSRSMNRNKT